MAEGFISDDDVQRVREASDIVAIIGEYTQVKLRGRDYWCCCPIHNEKTPSCKIDPALQLWHCFGCGEGGDVFGFVMKTQDLTFPEAVQRLAERAHIDIATTGKRGMSSNKKARLRDMCKAAAEFYHARLMRDPGEGEAKAREYLAGRGFGGEVAKRWMLGFAPGKGTLVRHLSSAGCSPEEMVEANVAMKSSDGNLRDRFFNRIMFPIFDAQGECIAFGGRVIGEGEPKYLNSQETPIFHKSQVLYGLDKAKAEMASTGIAVVVEGYTDVIALHEAGLRNVVATLGTALTIQHIRVLSHHARHKVVYLFDGDAAGKRASDRALQFIDESMTPEAGKSRIELCAVELPDNLDPAEFVDSRGAEALRALIDDAQPLIAYGIERRLADHDLSKAEGRARALSDALSVLAPIKDSLLAKDYAVQIASRVRAREQDVLNQLAALKPPKRFQDTANYDQKNSSRTSDRQNLDSVQLNTSGLDSQNTNSRQEEIPEISSSERNRLRIEREFLSLLSQNPLLALKHADTLGQTNWHDSVHALLARSLLSTLSDNPQASAADIVAAANEVHPKASGILTSSIAYEDANAPKSALYFVEELAIGDTEDTIAELKAQLAHPENLTDEEMEFTFNSLVSLQKELSQQRRNHKPLEN